MKCGSLVALVVVLVAAISGSVYFKSQPGPNGFGRFTSVDEVYEYAKERGVNLQEKNIIVTGGNSRVVIETVRMLAKWRPNIFLLTTERAKCDMHAKQIAKETGARLECQFADLSDFESLELFYKLWRHMGRPIHLMINGAALKGYSYEKNADGYEKQFATNHLGHFLLTNLLMKWIKEGEARIVTITSEAHKISDINYKDMWGNNTWNSKDGINSQIGPWVAYGQSKTANILFTVTLNEEIKGFGIANAVNPGRIFHETREEEERRERRAKRASLLGVDHWWNVYLQKAKTIIFGKSTRQGAATILYVATAPELATQPGGRYFEDCNPSNNVASYAIDKANADKLWKKSISMTSKYIKLL